MSALPGYLTRAQVAELLDVDVATVSSFAWRHADFPAPAAKVGHTPLWVEAQFAAWRAEHPARARRPGGQQDGAPAADEGRGDAAAGA